MQGPLLGGGCEEVHRPYKFELNMLMLEQVYHVTQGFKLSFTFIITDGCG